MDIHSYFSPQPKATSRNQGQSQQQRNPSQTNREPAREVEPSPTPSLSELLDELQKLGLMEKEIERNELHTSMNHSKRVWDTDDRVRLNKDEVDQIVLTARSAIKRYGSKRDEKTVFNNSYYQIKKFSVFETYGYQSYLTIDAHNGRGRLLG